MATATHLAKLYKNETLSDIRIQIWKEGCREEDKATTSSQPPNTDPASNSSSRQPAKRQRRSSGSAVGATVKPEEGAGSQPSQQNTDTAVMVEELPGHKAALFVASDYFSTMMERWENPDVFTLVVAEDKVQVARSLIHYIYHKVLPEVEPLSSKHVRQLAVMADQYQMADCVADCVRCLMYLMSRDDDYEAILEGCALIAALGPLDPDAVDSLFSAMSDFRPDYFHTLKTHLTEDRLDLVDYAVSILLDMFRDMDKTWARKEYQEVLSLFPLPVFKRLVSSDELECMSENVIVAAIDEWWCEQDFLNEVVEASVTREVLQLIRVPYLTASFQSQVFMSLGWVKACSQTAALMQAYNSIACGGSYNGVTKKPLDLKDVPPEWHHMFTPRRYKTVWEPLVMKGEVTWQQVQIAVDKLQNEPNRPRLHATCVCESRWHNGVSCNFELRVSKSSQGRVSLQACWHWRGLEPSTSENLVPCLIAGPCRMSCYHVDAQGVKMGTEGMDQSEYRAEQMAVAAYWKYLPEDGFVVFKQLPDLTPYLQKKWRLYVEMQLDRML